MLSRSDLILGRTIEDWISSCPVMADILELKETSWANPHMLPFEEARALCPRVAEDIRSRGACAAAGNPCPPGMADMLDAEERLRRFAPYIMSAFPGTAADSGIIESPLREASRMKAALEEEAGFAVPGRLLLKLDSHLPVSGSIKARGGIYEVLKTAEDIAFREGILASDRDDYSILGSAASRDIFSRYSLSVGSTGNLGLSIGIMGSKLGFNVTVHMSQDARKWKKDMLRSLGVQVIEYSSDYSEAVRRGRLEAAADLRCHFIDDESSVTLFLGYSAAALRFKKQLADMRIPVDAEHPLFVYLPCGVGGGPGGVAWGLRMIYGDSVHCFFAEPVHSCCMLLGMATGAHSGICVGDLGIDCRTAADGLAVGRASGFVGKLMEPFLSGCYTLSDERMLHMLSCLADTEGIHAEPSALAGMYGPVLLSSGASELSEYIKKEDLSGRLASCTHIVWLTGGSMVPEQEFAAWYAEGKKCII